MCCCWLGISSASPLKDDPRANLHIGRDPSRIVLLFLGIEWLVVVGVTLASELCALPDAPSQLSALSRV